MRYADNLRTFLHKNDYDKNEMQVIKATAIQKLHKNVSKLISVHQFVVILIVT